MVGVRRAAILVVEDERIIAKDLRAMLNVMGHDAFAIAATADEAVARAVERCPDLVLMDIRIGGERDGIETAALLRERFDVPVVYLTAHADDATIARAVATEPYGYLLKPVKPAELRSAIALALHPSAMDRRLRQRERRFATTLRSIGDAVITVGLGGEVTFMNPTAEVLTGVSAEDAIGKPAREVVRRLDPEQPASPLDAGPRDARGGERLISDSTTPLVDEGEPLGAVMVFRDVTEQKQLQKRLELADRLASLGTLAAGVAHEINNPLAVVVANVWYAVDLLRAEAASGGAVGARALGDVLTALAEVDSATTRIAGIVSDLRTFSRPGEATSRQGDVAEAVAWAVRTTAQEHRGVARVTADVEAGLKVELDDTRLGQVLVNLIVNATQALARTEPPTGAIAVEARVEGSEAVIRVRDNGAGMSPDVLVRVFEPFFTTKGVGSGTGLGLSICHGLVTTVGGRIHIESMPGEGTTVHVRLPLARSPEVAASVSAAVVAPAPRRGRVLLVDDEPRVARALARMLGAHDVTCLEDTREALVRLRAGESYDVVLCDVMAAHLSGEELYEQLLTSHPAMARRVVFTTGGSLSQRAADFLAVVPNTWLEKPITHELLTACVSAFVSDPGETTSRQRASAD